MSAGSRTKFKVLFERPGGTPDEPVIEEMEVWADQRDFSACERNRNRSMADLPPVEGLRWVVWHAGNRARIVLPGWPNSPEEFERVCLEVQPVKAEEIRPTLPAPEAG